MNKALNTVTGFILICGGLAIIFAIPGHRLEGYGLSLVGILFLILGNHQEILARLFLNYKSSVVGVLMLVGSWYLIKEKIATVLECSPIIAAALLALGIKDAIPFFNKNNKSHEN